MADTRKLKPRKGTTTQHNTYTGENGEVTLDTTKKTLVVHDGTTAGGQPLATESYAEIAAFNSMNIHEAAGDPHPQYLEEAEADALYAPIDAVSNHVAATNPHTQYLLGDSLETNDTATIVVPAGVSVLYLTAGALVASQEIDCTNLQDGGELIIYSTNGITALTISGGTVVGTLTTLAAGAFGRVVRSNSTLLVGA